MKNFREKFRKIKFLIPLVVGGLLTWWINNNPRPSSGGRRDHSDSTMIICVLIIAFFMSLHQWRMVYDEKYRKEKIKFFGEEKKKPWHRRTWNVGLAGIFSIMLIFAPIMMVASLSHFFWIGFSSGFWDQVAINVSILFLIFFLISYTALEK
jgi:hypothetical protein